MMYVNIQQIYHIRYITLYIYIHINMDVVITA